MTLLSCIIAGVNMGSTAQFCEIDVDSLLQKVAHAARMPAHYLDQLVLNSIDTELAADIRHLSKERLADVLVGAFEMAASIKAEHSFTFTLLAGRMLATRKPELDRPDVWLLFSESFVRRELAFLILGWKSDWYSKLLHLTASELHTYVMRPEWFIDRTTSAIPPTTTTRSAGFATSPTPRAAC